MAAKPTEIFVARTERYARQRPRFTTSEPIVRAREVPAPPIGSPKGGAPTMTDLVATQAHSCRHANFCRNTEPSAGRESLASPTDAQRVHRFTGEPDVRALANVARELNAHHSSVEHTLSAISSAALRIVPGAEAASTTTLLGRGRTRFDAPTDPLAAAVDDIQRDVDDGPSLRSIRDNETVLVRDVRSDSRFPSFTATALRYTAIRSILRLNLDPIGQAKGMIMERYATEPEHAFDMLSAISQETNTPVDVLAGRLTRREQSRSNT
ncbi:ANTAR domain-containing protein [Rhodococcus sp. 05-339-2]|nr:ANTAR domain-containing protein [Rhodococcus sp. 05-339-2]